METRERETSLKKHFFINKLASLFNAFYYNSHLFSMRLAILVGFPGGASSKEPTSQCRLDRRDAVLISGSGRSPGGGHGHPLQYSCLENPMARGAWRATVPSGKESDTTEAT